MPDTTGQRPPSRDFEQNVETLSPLPPSRKGGIIFPGNYKSFIVNIRPSKWEEKFWIGQIENYVDAQFIAELVFYFIGQPVFHLKNANFTFPHLQCWGSPTPLTNREMCSKFVSSIAKGIDNKPQRQNFILRVTELARRLVMSDEVQRILREFRDERGSAEGITGMGNEDDEVVQAAHPSPMEEIGQSGPATHPSSAPKAMDGDADWGSAFVPTFDMSGPGFNLQSADLLFYGNSGTAVEEMWADDYLNSLMDCDYEDSYGSFDTGEGASSSTKRFSGTSLPYSSYCSSASENFEANFFAN